jgi:HD superfamily phosphodiesterase
MNDIGGYKDIDLNRFTLLPEYFDHQSNLHGINHTYRVMYHCLELGLEENLTGLARLAFMAAFIHDMARTHDGFCMVHGARAAEEKLPKFINLFLNTGASEAEIALISVAVRNHSLPAELPATDPAAVVTALLKDADALDRIRLGEDNLRPEYLRFNKSHSFIIPARELYYKCGGDAISSFAELLSLAGDSNRSLGLF